MEGAENEGGASSVSQGSRLGTQNLNLTPRDGTRKRGSRSEGQAASSGLEALKSKELGEHPGRDAGTWMDEVRSQLLVGDPDLES